MSKKKKIIIIIVLTILGVIGFDTIKGIINVVNIRRISYPDYTWVKNNRKKQIAMLDQGKFCPINKTAEEFSKENNLGEAEDITSKDSPGKRLLWRKDGLCVIAYWKNNTNTPCESYQILADARGKMKGPPKKEDFVPIDEEITSRLVNNALQRKTWQKIDRELNNPVVVYHRNDNVLVISGDLIFSGAKIDVELLKKYHINPI